jgi:hypothetical protein
MKRFNVEKLFVRNGGQEEQELWIALPRLMQLINSLEEGDDLVVHSCEITQGELDAV